MTNVDHVAAPPSSLQLTVSQVGGGGVAVECRVGGVYPQPASSLVILTSKGWRLELDR